LAEADALPDDLHVEARSASVAAEAEGISAKVGVPFEEQLQQDVRAAVAQARALRESTTPPPPLVDSRKCPRCSLVGICLPDETNLLIAASRREPKPKVRQILPAEEDRQPCHVQANGAVVGKNGETLQIRTRDGGRQDVGLRRISHLSVYGQVQLTPGAIQGLCAEGVGVSFFSTGGWYYGSLGGRVSARRWPGEVRLLLLYLVHQRAPAMVVAIAFDPARPGGDLGPDVVVERLALPGYTDLTAATHVPDLERLLVIADSRDRIVVLRAAGAVEAEVVLPGLQQEGLGFDGAGRLWVADDRGGLLRFDGALAALVGSVQGGGGSGGDGARP
jgi:hypothetical protein